MVVIIAAVYLTTEEIDDVTFCNVSIQKQIKNINEMFKINLPFHKHRTLSPPPLLQPA